MKTISNWLLAALVMVAFCCSRGNAQTIIYSNSFSGGAVTVNGTAPTIANSLAGGFGSASWICTYTNSGADSANGTVLADGTIATDPGCALLPFTPQPGEVYFMTASLTVPASMANWVAMGFTQLSTQTNNAAGGIYSRYSDSPPIGYAWMDLKTGMGDQLFGGGRGSIAATPTVDALPAAGTYTLQIVLNTAGAHWTVSAFVNGIISGTNVIGGTQIGTNIVYGANPTIGFAGIGQNSFVGSSTSGVQWNYWALSVLPVASPATNNYWMAPAASGTGDGSSSANAASYLNYVFWSGIQNVLQSANVTVNLASGNYNSGPLNFTNIGNPVHRLTLQAANLYGAVFNSSGNSLADFYGCQNIGFHGVVFTGPTAYWGFDSEPYYLNPCRNLEFSYCQFLNLTNAYYGAIGLINGDRDVLVDNCTFTNIGSGAHAHMIYASHNIVGVVATNCVFQDCLADYVRFRDDSEYIKIQNCSFISTTSASGYPFVTAELYNETNGDAYGDEFFGNGFQISGCSFTYDASGGPGPYAALHFSDTGYTPWGYDCTLTSSQASLLSGGTTSFQQSFLQTNIGINASNIKMFGNTYNSRVAYHMDYAYVWDGNAPYGGWQGTIKLDNAPDTSGAPLGPTPALRNGNFDRQGLLQTPVISSEPNQCLFQTWFCNPKYTSILWHPGFNGTSNAMRFNKSTSQYIYQWITPPGPAWTMDFLFTVGSGFTGTGVKFKVDIFHNDIVGSKVSIGVNDLGQFGIYNNAGTFTVLPELGTVAFSVDNNNGYYSDPGDVLNVYRVRIVGNYAASTPCVNIYTSDANNPALTHQSLNLADWVSGAPISGLSQPETVAFYNYTAPVVVDQIAIAGGLAEQPPVINSLSSGRGQFIFSGTNGFPGDTYYLFSSTNLVSPGGWTLESSNSFDSNGVFSITNSTTPGTPQKFYRLELQ